MANLALLGGDPVWDRKVEEDFSDVWPIVNEATGEKLKELYLSQRWAEWHGTIERFIGDFAEHHGARHAVFMANGTVTLQCALSACGIGPGDEVIVPALTWYATAMAAHFIGAIPVFVDIDNETLCIDPEKVEQAITEKTKAIIPVHVYGSMTNMERIQEIAARHNIRVIEDCAHMHGGEWDGRGVGTIGDVGSFSFQFSKTMTSGEGGVCITNDSTLADRIFRISHIGYSFGKTVRPLEEGLTCHNFRATAFQALILSDQLAGLNARLSKYNKAVQYLEERLGSTTQLRFQKQDKKTTKQGYYGWVMIFDSPEYADIPISVIKQAMTMEGIAVHPSWGPVYDFVFFNLKKELFRVHEGRCLITEHNSKRMLWLLHAYLNLDMGRIEIIGDIIEKVMNNIDELRKFIKMN